MKRFIRSIARTMGLAALVSLGGAGCRFDLDSLRKDGGVQITDSGMNDGLILADGSYADGKKMEDGPKDGYNAGDALLIADGSLDALLIPDAAIDAPIPDGALDALLISDAAPVPDAPVDAYLPLPDAPFQDAIYLPDAFTIDAFTVDAPPADTLSPDANVTDGGMPVCYANNFNEESALADLLIQNGIWIRDVDGFLKQTEEYDPSWRIAYVPNSNFGDVDAVVRIRMIESTNPQAGVDNHAGILLRFDPQAGTGYVAQLQYSNNDTVQVSLDDLASGQNLQYVTIDCGDIGCGYGNWYTLRTRMAGDDLRVYLNGSEKLSVTNSTYSSGKIGFACYARGESHYDDLQVCPPGELLPSLEYSEDDFCIFLSHFNLPNYFSQNCSTEANLADNGTVAVESLSGFGQGRFFNGNSSMTATVTATREISDRLTIEMLVKPAQAAQSFLGGLGNLVRQIDDCGQGGNSYCGFGVQIYGDNHIGATIGLGQGIFNIIEGSIPLPVEAWSHIAFTYNGEAMRIYVNGYLDEMLPVSGFLAPAADSLYLGSSPGQLNSFIGSIDELRISNIVRLANSCTNNSFSNDLDLADLVIQNGGWEIWDIGNEGYNNSEGNLSQVFSEQGPHVSYLNNSMNENVDVTIRVRPASCNSCFTGLLFRYVPLSPPGVFDPSVDKGYLLGIGNSNGSVIQLALLDSVEIDNPDWWSSALNSVQVPGDPYSWYTLRTRAIGSQIKVYFNGGEVFTINNSTYSSGYIGFVSIDGESNYDALEICPLP